MTALEVGAGDGRMRRIVLYSVGSPLVADAETSCARAGIAIVAGMRNVEAPAYVSEAVRVIEPQALTDAERGDTATGLLGEPLPRRVGGARPDRNEHRVVDCLHDPPRRTQKIKASRRLILARAKPIVSSTGPRPSTEGSGSCAAAAVRSGREAPQSSSGIGRTTVARAPRNDFVKAAPLSRMSTTRSAMALPTQNEWSAWLTSSTGGPPGTANAIAGTTSQVCTCATTKSASSQASRRSAEARSRNERRSLTLCRVPSERRTASASFGSTAEEA